MTATGALHRRTAGAPFPYSSPYSAHCSPPRPSPRPCRTASLGPLTARGLALGLTLALTFSSQAARAADPLPQQLTTPYLRAVTSKPFEDVVFELNHGIADENFRITGRNTIGAGIRARGYHEFPNAEIIHFCSLENAREVMALDPGFIAFMPCRVTVHEEASGVVVTMILLPEDHRDPRVNAFAHRLNTKLRKIFTFAVEKGE